ncbi:uncharacterized protein [Watersipora subatra]|uniref:uncharacterized protein n=1 Tax=Watersipora subatra TaxID=2589382 RepID=UPI00355B3F2B
MEAACQLASHVDSCNHEVERRPVKCGYCIQRCDITGDARVLPCKHIHCMACLQTIFVIKKVLRCPLSTCRKVFDEKLESLPQYARDTPLYSCDVCMKNLVKERAEAYCLSCSKKYCKKHLQSHEEILKEHVHMEINKYRLEAQQLEIRLCPIHTGLSYLRACKTCLVLMCVDCLCSPGKCTAETSHEMMDIDELALQLTQQIRCLISQVVDKEQRLAALLCLTLAAIDEHALETQQMLQSSKLKAPSKRHLVELRNKSKTEMQQFSDIIREQQTTISTCCLKSEARLKHSHKVDLIKDHTATYCDIQCLVKEELPKLRFENIKLTEGAVHEGCDFISYDCRLDHTSGLTSSLQLPKFINFLKTVRLTSPPLSLCHYEGSTYVGLQDGNVCKIDSKYKLHNRFLMHGKAVASIVVHKSKIYTLVYGKPMKIYMSNLLGESISSWDHTDSVQWSNKMTILKDRLIVPDRTNNQLVVYTLDGKIVKHIQCTALSQGWVAVCSVKVSNSVIISNYQTSLVFAIDVRTGGQGWTNRYTTDPLGITSYGQNNLLVFNGSAREIEVLQRNTGEVLLSLQDRELRKSDILDMVTVGNTLILPAYQSAAVHFYELIN